MNGKREKPLLMTLAMLKRVLVPYCKGKKSLQSNITDIWNSAIPTPNVHNGQPVKIIYPEHFKGFVQLALQENG